MSDDLIILGEAERRDFVSAHGLARQSGATGRFAAPGELMGDDWAFRWDEPTLLCGHVNGRLVGRRGDDRHMFVCASSRSGKGVSVIVPNIIGWTAGSLVINDPKGELAQMTAAAKRAQGFNVVVLNARDIAGLPTDGYNVFDEIDLEGPHGQGDLALLAEALVPPSKNVTDGDHWTSKARELFATASKIALTSYTRPTLVTVYNMLSGRNGTVLGTVASPSDVFAPALLSNALNGSVRAGATAWLETQDREQSSILSTLRGHLQWLETNNDPNAPVARVNASSTFRLADLKRRRTVVYLCLPARDVVSMSGWLRAFIMLAVAALERTQAAPGMGPTLMVLDEFPSLGYMPTLERAIGLIAGSGVRIMTVVQDLGQLKAIYPRSWGTFIGNSGVSLWFGLGGDPETAEYVSQRLGVTQYHERQEPGGSFVDRARSGLLHGHGQWVTAPLLYPHEVERAFARETGRLLALAPGCPPAILCRVDIRDGFLKEWINV